MAEKKSTKRKSASEAAPKAKKIKKVDHESTEKVGQEQTSQELTPPSSKPTKSIRKRAADFFPAEDNVTTAEAASVVERKSKRSRKSEPESSEPSAGAAKSRTKKHVKSTKSDLAKEIPEIADKAAKKPKSKGGKKSKDAEKDPESSNDEEDQLDDQTAALLKGFESSENEDEEEIEDAVPEIENVPAAPKTKALQKKLDAASGTTDERGVIYVGRIPHGFYEHQMQQYFSQFGDITRLRLSRNKKTGASKHYAFVEFASSEVARIVADTMDKYLMFGHILQVRTVPKEQVHENLFAGANSRYKVVPRNKLQGRHLRQPLHRDGWEARLSKEEERRAAKKKALKAIGYDFDIPVLKGLDHIPVKGIEGVEEPLSLTAGDDKDAAEAAAVTEVVRTVSVEPGKVQATETISVTKKPKSKESKKEKSVELGEDDAGAEDKHTKPKSTSKKESKGSGRKSKKVL